MNLKYLRDARGLTQKNLADQFHISQQAIYKYENNLAEPDIDMLIKLAEFFHTSVDYLVGYSSEFSDELTPQDSSLFETVTPMERHHLYQYRKLEPAVQKYYDGILDQMVPKPEPTISEQIQEDTNQSNEEA